MISQPSSEERANALVHTAHVVDLEGRDVAVEADVRRDLPSFSIIGLGTKQKTKHVNTSIPLLKILGLSH